jgi:hypothetical protein
VSIRLCVRDTASDIEFPLIDRLPSTTSAGTRNEPWFGGFPGPTQSSDFPRADLPGVRPMAFPGRPLGTSPAGVSGQDNRSEFGEF